MTNILINLLIAYAEYLRRVEAHRLNRTARQSSPAKVALIHNRVNAIAAERKAPDAMVRLYISRRRCSRERGKRIDKCNEMCDNS